MDLITISYQEHPFGFGRGVPRTFHGVRFRNGKIAFLNEAGEIRASESEAKLREALPDATIGPFNESNNYEQQPEPESQRASTEHETSREEATADDSLPSAPLAAVCRG